MFFLKGWIGFGSSVAEITGGLILSTLADMPKFNPSFKTLISICFICYFLSIFSSKPIIGSSIIGIIISTSLGGFFQGAGSPLTYESLAEIMYPLPESFSASILVELVHLTSLILFFIAPDRYKILDLTILIIILLCIILTISLATNFLRFYLLSFNSENRISFDRYTLHQYL